MAISRLLLLVYSSDCDYFARRKKGLMPKNMNTKTTRRVGHITAILLVLLLVFLPLIVLTWLEQRTMINTQAHKYRVQGLREENLAASLVHVQKCVPHFAVTFAVTFAFA